MKDKISIIVPIYNVDRYLTECIESLIHQTYQNLEIILVNDGSTDKSEEICLRYAQNDKRVRYIKKDNGGVSSARNTGIDSSTGDYITFVDPDDWCETNMYYEIIRTAKNYETDAVFCGFSMDSDLTSKSKLYGECFSGKVSTNKVWGHLFSQDGYYTSIWNKLFRANLIKNDKETLYFETNIIMGEDEEWLSRVMAKCESVYLLSEPLYHWIRHSSGACSTLLNNRSVTKQQLHGYKVAKLVRDRLSDNVSVRGILNARYYNAAFGLVKNLYLDGKKEEAKSILCEIDGCRQDWQGTFAQSNKSKVKHLLQRMIIYGRLPKKMLYWVY